MKVLFISKYNDGYLAQLKKKISPFKTFSESLKFFNSDFYYHYGSISHYLSENGHEAVTIIPNYDEIQDLWLKEYAIKGNINNSMAIVKLQIDFYQPDIVFLNSNFDYFPDLIPYSKDKGIKVCAWISCPIPKGVDLGQIDHIFTLFEPHHNLFKKQGIPSTLTHGAFDERVLDHISDQKVYPVSFIGGIGKYHRERESFLKKILRKEKVSIWGYGFVSNKKWKTVLKSIKHLFAFNKAFQGEVWGKEMFKTISKSTITINFHGDIALGHAVNMRLFESTGVGTLLLTEDSKNLKKFFEPGKEVVVYKSAEEAIRKIRYYLAHPLEAKQIADAGQKRTLKNYTYKAVTKSYITIFEKLLNNEK